MYADSEKKYKTFQKPTEFTFMCLTSLFNCKNNILKY